VVVGNAFRTELHACIGGLAAEKFELQAKLEIAVRLRGSKELVSYNFVLEGTSDDRTVLDAKDREVPFPTSKSFAVKDRGWLLIPRLLIERWRQRDQPSQCDNKETPHGHSVST